MYKPKFKTIQFPVELTSKEGYKIPKYDYKGVPKNSVRVYDTAPSILYRLTHTERVLLDWILINMTERNAITNSQGTRRKFIRYLAELDEDREVLSDKTIKTAFKGLCDKGVTKRIKVGWYIVNPELFFKGIEKEREKAIRLYLSPVNLREDNEYYEHDIERI
jgi:hypothetical protein